MKLTKYQREHRAVGRVQVKCESVTLNDDGMCVECGRFLKRAVAHRPNEYGSRGFVYRWSDGSTYTAKPGEYISH
jgi:hypothetical protein